MDGMYIDHGRASTNDGATYEVNLQSIHVGIFLQSTPRPHIPPVQLSSSNSDFYILRQPAHSPNGTRANVPLCSPIQGKVQSDKWWNDVEDLSTSSSECVEDCRSHGTGKGPLSVGGQCIDRDALLLWAACVCVSRCQGIIRKKELYQMHPIRDPDIYHSCQ
jgi:hypothetical protein